MGKGSIALFPRYEKCVGGRVWEVLSFAAWFNTPDFLWDYKVQTLDMSPLGRQRPSATPYDHTIYLLASQTPSDAGMTITPPHIDTR